MRGVVLMLMGLLCAACQPQAEALSSEDVTAINGAMQAFAEAALAGDFARAAETYAADAVFMPPGAPIYVGREAEIAHLESGPPVASFSISTDEVDGVGDLAYARGPYTISVLMGADTVSMQGKWLGVFRKQPDGSWQLSVESWNLDAPLPGGGG